MCTAPHFMCTLSLLPRLNHRCFIDLQISLPALKLADTRGGTAGNVLVWWLAIVPPSLTTSLPECTQGRFDEAESCSGQALEITSRTLGSEHPNYLLMLENHRALLEKRVRSWDSVGFVRELVTGMSLLKHSELRASPLCVQGA